MTSHDERADAHIDTALEALLRPVTPVDHVDRILARTGPHPAGRDGVLPRRPWWLAVPVAATLLIALGATWQLSRRVDLLPSLSSGWGARQAIDRPVLPPQAYWSMDPFEEFATLRPGTQEHKSTGTQDARDAGTQAQGHTTRADDELAWVPVPSGLPPIEVETIVPAPLVVPPVAPLEEIALAEIPLAPIVIAPFVEEEKP